MATTATILSGARTLLISYDALGGTTFTTSTSPTKFPVVTIGGGGNINTLWMEGVAVAAALVTGKLEITIDLCGYTYAGETVTVTIPSGFIVDDLGNNSPTVTNLSVNNTNGKTADSSYTRFKSCPIVTWATRDRWPQTTNTARIAFAAEDDFAGIDYCEVTFNAAVTIVASAYVTSLGSNVYRITRQPAINLFGYSHPVNEYEYKNQYWYIDLDITGVADTVNYCEATITKVRGLDGLDHNPTTGVGHTSAAIPAQRIAIRKTPNVKYLDATATGLANGSSPANAYTTVANAEAGAVSTTDKILIAPGNYSVTGTFNFDQSRTDRWIIWEMDTSMVGDASGEVVFNTTGQVNFRNYQAIKDVTFAVADQGTLRTAGNNHVCLEHCRFEFATKAHNSPMPFGSTSYIYLIGNHQEGGFRGPVFGRVGTTPGDNIVLHGCTVNNSGTGTSGQFNNFLMEHYIPTNMMTEGFVASPPASITHSDFFHPFDVQAVSGCTWTQSTRTIAKTGGFTGFPLTDYATSCVQITSGTGTTPNNCYPIVSMTADTMVLADTAVLANGADVSNLVINVIPPCYRNLIVRNTENSGNGADPWVYNFGLMEGGGRNFYAAGNISFNRQLTQTIYLMCSTFANVQMQHMLMIAQDNTNDAGGPGLSGNKTADPYTGIGLLIRNCIVGGISESLGGHASGALPASKIRKALFGPNIVTNQNADTVNNFIKRDGTISTSTGGNDAIGLTELDTAPFNFLPLESSDAHFDNWVAAPTGYSYDRYGNANNGMAGPTFGEGGTPPDPPDPPADETTTQTKRRELVRFR